ncbi:MAG: EF-hand domain-containing protein [Reyranellaceae bacterium]
MTMKMAGARKALLAGLLPMSLAASALLPISAAQAQQRPPAQAPAPPPAPVPVPVQGGQPQQAAPADPDALPPALAEYDANKDNAVEQKEFVSGQMKTFDEVDGNKDGFVTREEYLKQAEPPFIPADAKDLPPIEERRRVLNLRFTNLDSNQDGRISREEAEQSFVREFVIMDRDRNGRITINDLRIARAQAQQNQPVERVSKQQFLENEDAVFERIDENKDKTLVLSEFLTLAEGAPPANQEQVKARLTAAFAEIDANKDKKLDLTEWRVAAERNFARADRNNDGILDADELRAPPPPPAAAAPVEETRAQFVNNRTDELMARVDQNKDGKISLEEFLVLASEAPPAQAAQARTQLTASFNGMDGNKNGTVERSELVTHFTNIFNRIDANKDGKITEKEINALNSPPPAARPQPAPQQPKPAPQTQPRPAPQTQPKPAPQPRPQPAPQPAPQGGPPPAYPSGGQAPITTTPGSQPLR